ncbi:hypothetical protein F4777DRAFT_285977 [Nemania sp. FL0916]|nr:hypothetical protein F4777DRAFT_285977 [Nemania sp. FL0916]
MISQAQRTRSVQEYSDALDRLSEVLIVATDSDAIDASAAPLATAYCYQGHIYLGLGQRDKALAAYEMAARQPPRSLTDAPALRVARDRVVRLRAEKESGENENAMQLRGGGGGDDEDEDEEGGYGGYKAEMARLRARARGVLQDTGLYELASQEVVVRPGPGKKPRIEHADETEEPQSAVRFRSYRS